MKQTCVIILGFVFIGFLLYLLFTVSERPIAPGEEKGDILQTPAIVEDESSDKSTAPNLVQIDKSNNSLNSKTATPPKTTNVSNTMDFELLEDLEFTDGTPRDVMDKPIINTLSDISHFEQPFEAQLSLAPLLQQEISKVAYDYEVSSTIRAIRNGQVYSIGFNPDATRFHIQRALKEVIVLQDNGPNTNEIKYEESFHPITSNGKRLQPPKVIKTVKLDGRLKTQLSNKQKREYTDLEKYYSEVGPIFISTKVSKGSKWEQRIAVDSELNPNGEVSAQFEVKNMFIKDGSRYVRIHRQYGFKTYRDPITVRNMVERIEPREYTIQAKVDELFDFNVDTGVVENKSIVTRLFFDGHGFPSSEEGMIVEITEKETLKHTIRK